jgi:hypothetical protein
MQFTPIHERMQSKGARDNEFAHLRAHVMEFPFVLRLNIFVSVLGASCSLFSTVALSQAYFDNSLSPAS